MKIEGTGPLREEISRREALLTQYAKFQETAVMITEKAQKKAYAKYDLDRFLFYLLGVGFLGVTLALWLGSVFESLETRGYWAIIGYGILIGLTIWDLIVFFKAKKEWKKASVDAEVNRGKLAEIAKKLADCEAKISPLITQVVVLNDTRYTIEALENDIFKGETVQDRLVWYDLWARAFLGEDVSDEAESELERRVRAVRKNL